MTEDASKRVTASPPVDQYDPCPICSSASPRLVGRLETTRPFAVVQCRACRTVYAAPRPTAAELVEFYSADYFEGPGKRYDDYQGCAEPNARAMWHVLNGWYDLGQAPNRRVLDVGAATGGFIDEARKSGWEVDGVELSDAAAAVARDRGLPVRTGDLGHADLRDDYGLVTMWHVVEHLIDPVAGVQQAAGRLAPGGLLLIELPNWNSVGRFARGMQWSALTPPEHINFFTPRTLRAVVADAGLVVVKSQTPHHKFLESGPVKRVVFGSAGTVLGALGFGGYLRLLARRD